MRMKHLLHYGECYDGESAYNIGEINRKILYDLHLKCPRCEKEIVIAESVLMRSDSQEIYYIDFKPV